MGQRLTGPRKDVLRVLSATSGNLTVDEIVAALHQKNHTVHRATVYRTVEALSELGMVWVTSSPQGAASYHLASLPKPHDHVHMRCAQCGNVIAIDLDLFDQISQLLRDEAQVYLDPNRSELVGRCSACQGASSEY